MDRVVLDASAVLAVLQEERGGDRVLALLNRRPDAIAISSVNLCEVMTRLVREGTSQAEVAASLTSFRRYSVDFDLIQAERAAELYRKTKSHGLSLGDRACLALAATLGAGVWTTDSAWMKLKLGVDVELIRSR